MCADMPRKSRNDVPADKEVHARLSPAEHLAVARTLAEWQRRSAPKRVRRSDLIRLGLKALAESVSVPWPQPTPKVT